ncbi:MAG TPA: cation:proton antiporter, partial [Opitutaceae bacterium]|nr:cation:proton antiporter [Opitutaceae bacterium]
STISLVTPFLAYLPADLMGASGIISVVTVGVFLGWNSIDTITARVRLLVFPMWEMIEFVLNGFIFLAIGLQLPTVWHGLSGTPLPVLAKIAGAVCAAVTGVRILWVFPATYCPRLFSRSLARRDPYPPAKSVVLVAWIGMRGVVSLAAAMALPLDQDNGTPFPGRDLIIFLTFSVILSTLVLQGLSLAPLVRWFKLQREDDGRARELVKAWRRAHESALIRIEELASQKKAPEDALARARQRLEAQIALSEDFETAQAVESGRASAYSFVNRVEREIVQAQRREIVKLRNEGAVSFSVAREILRDLDLAEEKLH